LCVKTQAKHARDHNIKREFGSYEKFKEEVSLINHRVESVMARGRMPVYDVEVDCPTLDDKTPSSGHNFLIWDGEERFGSGVVVANTRRAAKLVCLDIDHPDIEEFIWCKAWEEEKARALKEAGFDMNLNTKEGARNWASLQYQNANNSVRVTQEFLEAVKKDKDWNLVARVTNEVVKTLPARELIQQMAQAAHASADPGIQFDTTYNDWHTTPSIGRINSTNPCSEYASNDNTSCNLASLNLMKFRSSDGSFNVEGFRQAVRVIFTAQEILISFADYPTEKIAENTRALRQIGIGYTNLGALLMDNGLAYDSEEGRNLAASITALMTGESYVQSGLLAERMGSFEHFEDNRKPMNQVLRKHRSKARELKSQANNSEIVKTAKKVWDQAVAKGEEDGMRNAQASVIAPAGCLIASSLIPTSRGLVRLRNLGNPEGDRWQPINLDIATDQGSRSATQFYVNGAEQVVSVKTNRGYSLKGTPTHRIKIIDEQGNWTWKRLADLQAKDRVPMSLNQIIGSPQQVDLPPLGELHWNANFNTKVPRNMSKELAEFVGYFMGDGSLHAKGIRLCVFEKDEEVKIRLIKLAKDLFNLDCHQSQCEGYIEVSFHSVPLVIWFEACGFKKFPPYVGKSSWIPHIPDSILASNDPEIYRAFIRGLFEADGNANHGYAYWNTTKECFSIDVQNLLLALGFVTTRYLDVGKDKFGANCHRIRLLNANSASRFVREIGFISKRKNDLLTKVAHPQSSKGDLIPMSRAIIDEQVPANSNLRKNLLLSMSRVSMVTRSLALKMMAEKPNDHLENLLNYYYDEIKSIELKDEEPTFDLSVPDNTTYLANGFISHNTISFLLDCDTTGIEPDFALTKYKKLVGGGTMTIVNNTVASALDKLDYDTDQVRDILEHLRDGNSIMNAPHLDQEHYPIFACAIGENAITPEGHIKMMAAVQPFVSGSISKTINVPTDTTVQDIMDLYLNAGELGIKAAAIYRDGSKVAQPLSSDKETKAKLIVTSILGDDLLRGQRRRLDQDCQVIRRNFKIGQISGYLHIGLFPDGTPGDIFVTVSQAGSALRGMIDAWATTVSMALQHGCPLDALVSKLAFSAFEPAGFTNDIEIRSAKSIVDYVMRFLAARFLDQSAKSALGINIAEVEPDLSSEFTPPIELSSPTKPVQPSVEEQAQQEDLERKPNNMKTVYSGVGHCERCGGMLIQTGSCMSCTSCGQTGGCG
jgi:ribonucleoside-diphosphate reductase alpha chain